jgi:hypothetical protein
MSWDWCGISNVMGSTRYAILIREDARVIFVLLYCIFKSLVEINPSTTPSPSCFLRDLESELRNWKQYYYITELLSQ